MAVVFELESFALTVDPGKDEQRLGNGMLIYGGICMAHEKA